MSDLEIGTVIDVGDHEWGRGVILDTGKPLIGEDERFFASAAMLRQLGASLYGKVMVKVIDREVVEIVKRYDEPARSEGEGAQP